MRRRRPEVSKIQLKIAKEFKIPKHLMHTINVIKAKEYIAHLNSPEGRLEQFFQEKVEAV